MPALIRRPVAGAAAPAAAASSKAGASRFQYKSRSAEQVRERAQRSIGGRDSFFNNEIQFFTPRVGDNTVRIMPPPPDAPWGKEHYGLNLSVHYGIGADQSGYLCLAKMKNEPCPLCEERDRANRAGEEELADDLRPSQRVAFYVIDRAQEGKGPLLWNCPAGVDKDIIKLCIDPTGEVLPVDDPIDGYDLSFAREGEGLKTKYKGIQFSRRVSPLADDPKVMDKWLQHIVDHPIDACLTFHEADYIRKVFEGQAPPATEEEQTPAPRTPVGRAAAPTAAPAGGRIALRKPAAPVPEPEPAPAPAGGGEELPTWDDLAAADEDALGAMIDDFQLEVPENGFADLEDLRSFVAKSLEIEQPAPAPAAKAASWKDRLAKLKK